MRRLTNLVVVFGLLLAVYGCKKQEEAPAAPGGAASPATAAKEEPKEEEAKEEGAGEGATEKAGSEAAAANSVGVPECDEYITKYEKCLDEKVPEASRAPMKDAFAKTRESWKKMAENEATKAGLTQACKQAMEAAKTSMKAMGCEF